MRFAICTIDRYLGVFDSFVRAGWEPLKLFTVPLKCDMGNQQAVIDYAGQKNVAIQLSKITELDLTELRDQKCDALIVASYDWKIPDWRPYVNYAVNFHSSPLPEGRGPYPVVRALLEHRKSWAITCHQLTSDIDNGAILAAENFPIQDGECHESLDLKIQMAAKRLTAKVAAQFVPLWDQAKPQIGGSYWKKYKLEERVVDFKKPVEEIKLFIRAFGATESLANINGTWLIVKRAVGWEEAHKDTPGHVMHVFNQSIVVAAADGYIALLDHMIAPPHVVDEINNSKI